nr:uncharacterized protein LOC122269396 isoform X2 [Parasteatoda tepidariorum]
MEIIRLISITALVLLICLITVSSEEDFHRRDGGSKVPGIPGKYFFYVNCTSCDVQGGLVLNHESSAYDYDFGSLEDSGDHNVYGAEDNGNVTASQQNAMSPFETTRLVKKNMRARRKGNRLRKMKQSEDKKIPTLNLTVD